MPTKLFTIIKREWTVRVRTRGFLVFTLGIPLIAAAFLFMEFRIVQASRGLSSHIAVVDLSHAVYPELAAVNAHPAAGQTAFELEPVSATPATLPTVEASLLRQVRGRRLDGFLVLPADVLRSGRADYHTRNAAAVAVRANLQSELGAALSRARMAAAGLSPAQIANLGAGVDLTQYQITANGDRGDAGASAGLAMALAVILYIFLLLYGVVVMKSVTEEKTTRISEVLLAAVDPFSLMLGKILGVVSVALTQFVVWVAALGIFVAYGAVMAYAAGFDVSAVLSRLTPGLVVCFILFFLLGFLLYSSIYAAIGAMVSTDQEAQQTQMPLTMLLVASIYIAFLVMNNPNGPLSVGLSLVPFFAPILMMVRVAVSNPPIWEVTLSMALCAAAFLFFTRVTARIYRVGILMTGKRPTLPELLRWLRQA